MKYSLFSYVAFMVTDHPDDADQKVTEHLRQIEGGEFSGARGCWGDNIRYYGGTVHASSRDEAEWVAWELAGQAIRDAGYKAVPGWFAETPVDEKAQQAYDGHLLREELMEHFDDMGKCACVDDPTHGDLIPLEHVRRPG